MSCGQKQVCPLPLCSFCSSFSPANGGACPAICEGQGNLLAETNRSRARPQPSASSLFPCALRTHAHTGALASRTHRPPPPFVVTREQRPRRGRSVPSGGSQLSRWPNPYQRSTWLHCQLPIRLVKKKKKNNRKKVLLLFLFLGTRAFIRARHDPSSSRYSSAARKSRLWRDKCC